MKKLFTTLFAFAIVVSMSVLASCGGAPSNERVEELMNKPELSEDDYGELISYVEAAADEAIPVYQKLETAQCDAAAELEAKADALDEKYKYFGEVLFMLDHATSEELGAANVMLYNNLLDKIKDM